MNKNVIILEHILLHDITMFTEKISNEYAISA